MAIYYLPIQGHFVVGDGNKYYDWTGKVETGEQPISLEHIRQTDNLWYEKLMRDCFA